MPFSTTEAPGSSDGIVHPDRVHQELLGGPTVKPAGTVNVIRVVTAVDGPWLLTVSW